MKSRVPSSKWVILSMWNIYSGTDGSSKYLENTFIYACYFAGKYWTGCQNQHNEFSEN